MRILLFGEYSNLHATLAESFRRLGHEVVVISDGDHWRNYKRDIDLRRNDSTSKIDGIWFLLKLLCLLPKMRGFDVVQIINPKFLPVKAHFSRWLLKYLHKHNRCISMGCYGMDSIVMRRQNEGCLEYSDTFCYGKPIHQEDQKGRVDSWLMPEEIKTTEYAANAASCLMACLYEYYVNYNIPQFHNKLNYIALPIVIDKEAKPKNISFPIKILVGIQEQRMIEKGIDQILPLIERLQKEYPEKIHLKKVTNVPFDEYKRLLQDTDVLIDQLYSYTPAMNALEAMRNGTVVVSGGEEEFYNFIGEKQLRPIINLRPFEDNQNYLKLKECLFDEKLLNKLSDESIKFVRKYHDSNAVAQQYIEVYTKVGRF